MFGTNVTIYTGNLNEQQSDGLTLLGFKHDSRHIWTTILNTSSALNATALLSAALRKYDIEPHSIELNTINLKYVEDGSVNHAIPNCS